MLNVDVLLSVHGQINIAISISGNPRWSQEAVQLGDQGQHRGRPRHGQQADNLHQTGELVGREC